MSLPRETHRTKLSQRSLGQDESDRANRGASLRCCAAGSVRILAYVRTSVVPRQLGGPLLIIRNGGVELFRAPQPPKRFADLLARVPLAIKRGRSRAEYDEQTPYGCNPWLLHLIEPDTSGRFTPDYPPNAIALYGGIETMPLKMAQQLRPDTPLWLRIPVLPVTAAIVAIWLFGRVLLARRASRSRKSNCRNCAYNLTGNVSGICPECGERTFASTPERATIGQQELGQSRNAV